MNYKILKPQQPESNGFSYCKKYKLHYIAKRKSDFIEDVCILGEVDLEDVNPNDTSEMILKLVSKNGTIQQYNVKPLNCEIKDSSLLIYVGNNEYVALRNKKPVILAKLSALIIPLIIFMSINTVISALYITKVNNINFKTNLFGINRPIIENAEDWDGELPINNNSSLTSQEKSDISIPGYSSLSVSTENKYIGLINPTSNDVYFKYIIDIDGFNIYTSNMIEPGKSLNVNIFDILQKGVHNVNFKIETYDIITMEKYNGATQKVRIEVK